MSFWGVIIKGNSVHDAQIPDELNLVLTQAAIVDSDQPSTLYVNTESINNLALCTLTSGKIDQSRLDLLFEGGNSVKFQVKGKGDIHLTGYLVATDSFDDELDLDESFGDVSDEEEEEETKAAAKNKPQKASGKRAAEEPKAQNPSKKQKGAEGKAAPKPESPKSPATPNSPGAYSVLCSNCNKNFPTPHALAQHQTIKHSKGSGADTPPAKKDAKKEGKKDAKQPAGKKEAGKEAPKAKNQKAGDQKAQGGAKPQNAHKAAQNGTSPKAGGKKEGGKKKTTK